MRPFWSSAPSPRYWTAASPLLRVLLLAAFLGVPAVLVGWQTITEWPGLLREGFTTPFGVESGDIAYGRYLLDMGVLVAAVLCSRFLPASNGFGSGWGEPPRRVARFITGAAATWAIQGLVSIVGQKIKGHVGEASVPDSGFSTGEMVFIAARAGVTEELLNIALPVGLAYFAAAAVSSHRVGRGRAPFPASRIWWIAVGFGGLWGLANRYVTHMYQGPTPAVLTLVWGAALLLLFVWTRSVWPLVLGHFVRDCPLPDSTDVETWTWLFLIPLLVVLFTWLGVPELRLAWKASVKD